MRKKSEDLKSIKATLTVRKGRRFGTDLHYGFDDYEYHFGAITPNPLPNGVQVYQLKVIEPLGWCFYMQPPNMQATINNIRVQNKQRNATLGNYLSQHVGQSIPITLHF